MPRKISRLAASEQPIDWFRAFWCGMVGASVMMGFIDIFYMLGVTPFTYEQYLGGLLLGTKYGPQNWILGLLANWFVGGLFGFVYAFYFESVFRRSSGRVGAMLGFGHAVLASIALFPFFNILQQQAGTEIYPGFGFFGSGLGAPTPILLLMGNLLFGVTMGTLYGPIGAYRVRAREYEPGETGSPGESGVISEEEDPIDRQAV